MTISTENQSVDSKAALIVTVQNMQRQIEQLEESVALIRRQMNELLQTLTHDTTIVARFTIEGECYEITQAEVDAARAKLVKPRAERTLHTLILARKMAERHQGKPSDAKKFFELVEQERNVAIADGTAIAHEWEAAIGD